jgi:precorrin-3B C17-methyltransferase
MKKGKIYILGLGPGDRPNMTEAFLKAIQESDVIVTYKTYAELIKDLTHGKEVITANMKEELMRAKTAIEKALQGKTVAVVSSGDPQVYGMASPTLELLCLGKFDVEVKVVPGVTAALAVSALLGAPLSHDFAVISLSDLLTPREEILRKVRFAAEADFVIALYNPINPVLLMEAVKEISRFRSPSTPVGIVKAAGRENEWKVITTLREWENYLDHINMVTTLIVGNSRTYTCGDLMITPRGYGDKYELHRYVEAIRNNDGVGSGGSEQGGGTLVKG